MCLFGRRVSETASGRAHVPEIATDKVATCRIVMQDRRERCVAVRLRLAVAKTATHGSGIGTRGLVQFGYRPRKPRFRHVAEGASLVVIYREVLVVQHQLAEEFNLLHLVVRRSGQPVQSPRFDAIDLRFNLGDVP